MKIINVILSAALLAMALESTAFANSGQGQTCC